MVSKLDQLRKMTVVVADTGDMEAVARLKPVDCTTNPSLVLKALELESFSEIFDQAVKWGKSQNGSKEAVSQAVADRLAVAVGLELLKHVPGRISTEVDANLSFDVQASITKARAIIAAYHQAGIERDRILIKLAATWEGIQAAKILQQEGINCNLTLLFCQAQAVACADAGVFLISPFVGRIYDWYKNKNQREYVGEEDPGVQSVRNIYHYYKAHDIKTIVMGASFRNVGEIEALAGCDQLTISPALLDVLDSDQGTLERKLSPDNVTAVEKIIMDEKAFRWHLNEDAMATEKLAEGIRAFAVDLCALTKIVSRRLA